MMFRAALIVLASVWSLSAASGGSSGGVVDPFDLGPPFLKSGESLCADTKAVALRASQTLDTSVRNLVLIADGQSNMADVAPSVYSPANPTKISNFNIFDGALYEAKDPLMGATCFPTTPGHPALRVADTLITNGKFDHVVIVPIGTGATAVAEHATAPLLNRMAVTFGRLAARGMVAGTNITVVIIWGQGESDHGTSQAAYTASLTTVINASRAAGFAGKWFVAEQTYLGGVDTTVQAAQLAIVNHGAGIWAGPNADALVGNICVGAAACRVVDDIHFSDAGSASYAAAWVTALAASGAPF